MPVASALAVPPSLGDKPKVITPASAAKATLQEQLDGYTQEAANLGKLTPDMSAAMGPLVDVFADGGSDDMQAALVAGLSIAAGAGCEAATAGAVSPLCVLFAGVVGDALSSIFADPPPPAPTLADTEAARYAQTYNALLPHCPDDRAATGDVYRKCAAQLAFLSRLFTDGVCFPDPRSDGDPNDPANQIDTSDVCWRGQGGIEGTGFATFDAYYASLCASTPDAWTLSWELGKQGPNGEKVWTEPLEEFRYGCTNKFPAVLAARRKLWRFPILSEVNGVPSYYEPTGPLGPTSSSPAHTEGWPGGVEAFQTATRRVLTAARAENERRFQGKVEDFAHAVQDFWLPLCEGSGTCEGFTIKDSWDMAYQTLSAARGLALAAGTPKEIALRWIDKIDANTILGESHVDAKATQEHKTDARQQARDDLTKDGAPRPEDHKPPVTQTKPSGLTAGKVAGGIVLLALAAGVGLGAERRRRGLPAVPKTWKPKGWLK